MFRLKYTGKISISEWEYIPDMLLESLWFPLHSYLIFLRYTGKELHLHCNGLMLWNRSGMLSKRKLALKKSIILGLFKKHIVHMITNVIEIF